MTLFELSPADESSAELAELEEAVENGEVFTRRWIVELILDLAGYTSEKDLALLKAVEPACGSGAFLLPMVERLVASCAERGRSVEVAREAISAFDLVPGNVAQAKEKVFSALVSQDIPAAAARSLTDGWVRHGDYLTDDSSRMVDFVIGNPPYVRLEAVPASRQTVYRTTLSTMGGRADIFVGFYERGILSLKPDGVLAFICADRWMRNSYGKHLRGLVSRTCSLNVVLTCHDVDAFEESVSAYPAITILARGAQDGLVIADASARFTPDEATSLVDWVGGQRQEAFVRPGVSAAALPTWPGGEMSWPTGTPEQLRLLADLENRLPPLEDTRTGTKVGIGVATGADSVFVTSDPPEVEESRLLPLSMTSDIRSGKLDWSGHYLVSPWDERGLVDLENYPKLKHYFEGKSAVLRQRSIAKRQPAWFRTIDKVTTSLTDKRKLYFADMAMRIWPVMDEGKTYPHHNLYWVTSTRWDLEVLGGILLSDIAELFVSCYCVKMRGGTLRFQAQYLRRIRVPHLSSIGEHDRTLLRQAFRARDSVKASEVSARLYGIA